MSGETIAIASDHAGFELKETLKQQLSGSFKVADLGPNNTESVDYPDFADAMAQWLKAHPGSKGILVCGSGIGISIAANRHKHVRAALCRSAKDAEMSRRHNDANVICLGGREPFLNEAVAKESVNIFLTTPFEGGRHQGRVDKMSACGTK